MSAPELHFKSFKPTFSDFINGVVAIGDHPMVVDETTRSTVQDTRWTTVYGYRHDPKNPIDAPGSLQKLTDLFYSKYPLKDERYTKMRFKVICTIFKYYGDLLPSTTLLPRANNLQSQLFAMNDVLSRDDDVVEWLASAGQWLTEKIGEELLFQINLQVDEFRKPR